MKESQLRKIREGLGGRASILFASRSLVLGMNLVAGVLVARGLGPTSRGMYALAVLVPMLLAQTVSLGLNSAAVYLTGQGRYPLHQIVATFLGVAFGLGSTSAVLAYWGLALWGRSFLGQLPLSLLSVTLTTLPFLLWADLLGHVLLGQERTEAFALQAMIQSVVLLAAQGAGFLWARGQLEVALAGWLLAQASAALSAVIMLAKNSRLSLSFNWALLQEALRFGKAAYVTSWLQFVSLRLDQLLVQAWVGSAALGQYAVAVSLTEALFQLPVSVGAVLFARIATIREQGEQAPASSASSASRMCRLTVLVMLTLAVLTGIIARPALIWLFGTAYQAALPALYALLPGTVALVLPNVIGGYLYGRGMPQYVTYGAGLALLVTIIGDVVLIPAYGIVGAGLASSIAYGVYGSAMVILGQRLSGEPWYHFLIPSRSDWQWVQGLGAKTRR